MGCSTHGYPHAMSGTLHGAGVLALRLAGSGNGASTAAGRTGEMWVWQSPGRRGSQGRRRMLERWPPPQELEGLLCWAAWRGEMVMAGRDPAAPCTGLAGFPNSRSGGGCVLGGPWQPLQSQDSLSYRRGAGERESSSYGGQAAEGMCCAHGSS